MTEQFTNKIITLKCQPFAGQTEQADNEYLFICVAKLLQIRGK